MTNKKQHLTTPPYCINLYKNELSVLNGYLEITTPITVTPERRSGNLRSIDNGLIYIAEIFIPIDSGLARYLVEIGKILKGRGEKYPSEKLSNREKVKEFLLEITNNEERVFLSDFIEVSIKRDRAINTKTIRITCGRLGRSPLHNLKIVR